MLKWPSLHTTGNYSQYDVLYEKLFLLFRKEVCTQSTHIIWSWHLTTSNNLCEGRALLLPLLSPSHPGPNTLQQIGNNYHTRKQKTATFFVVLGCYFYIILGGWWLIKYSSHRPILYTGPLVKSGKTLPAVFRDIYVIIILIGLASNAPWTSVLLLYMVNVLIC